MSTEIEALEKRIDKLETRQDKVEADITEIKVGNGIVNEKLNTMATTLKNIENMVAKLSKRGFTDVLGWFTSKAIPSLITGGIIASIILLVLKVLGKI
ncbi:hypothetical protein [Pseudobacteroides cellulosolvens]|uniref:Uncharacterized protein n=1 Tax=Pseudobacteroides cellulosolvens ATCC 35603 = DSM 2933 TaxID=398512 RepID=A0A0L6JKC5_9FIRM|nr:hypothetical protein [Pseudobacteroides cellulosolvens]KNY26311.1 hypothetical protein Bccel_1573 [Pseudobacteroides cellulosolvens ATCC 35603 = DSM 2933]